MGSELELLRALPPWLAPAQSPLYLSLGGLGREGLSSAEEGGGAFHSRGASHWQPSVLRKAVDCVGSCSHPASFERKDFSFVVSSENEGPGGLVRLAQVHAGGGSNPVFVYFRTLHRHYLCLQLFVSCDNDTLVCPKHRCRSSGLALIDRHLPL